MKLAERIDILSSLGQGFADQIWEERISEAYAYNPWFTPSNIRKSLNAIREKFLNKEKLVNWTSAYQLDHIVPKRVGLIPAGNIPLVGIHDIISVLVSGHHLIIKPSEKDKVLTLGLLDDLTALSSEMSDYIQIVDKMMGYEAVIATGSDNSARYFHSYFKHVPYIIRRNRNSVGVLTGEESGEDLHALGSDIFTYFGMGCRNVSKIYLPEGYNLHILLEALHQYNDEVIHHNKYFNNFEYNIALLLLNKMPYLNNGSIILTESDSLHSRIACLNYQYYSTEEDLYHKLQKEIDSIQCVASSMQIKDLPIVKFGNTQAPELQDYADGVDTLSFLSKI